MRGPIDTSGSKNALQQRRSTRTYLRIDTYEAVTGIATDYAEDDDGNGAGPPVDKITEDQVLAIESRITDNDLPMDAFMSWLASFGIQRIEDIPVDYFAKVMSKIDVTITARKDKA